MLARGVLRLREEGPDAGIRDEPHASDGLLRELEEPPLVGLRDRVLVVGEVEDLLAQPNSLINRHLRGPRVLHQDDGKPVHENLLQLWIERATGRAGLEVTRSLHILRHTFCSRLAMKGAPAKAIQELAGHANLTTTMRYMHLSPAARESAIRLLDGTGGIFGEIVETRPAVGARS